VSPPGSLNGAGVASSGSGVAGGFGRSGAADSGKAAPSTLRTDSPPARARGYEIVSGHHRKPAAERADVPCWVHEMSYDDAYMALALCNAQGGAATRSRSACTRYIRRSTTRGCAGRVNQRPTCGRVFGVNLDTITTDGAFAAAVDANLRGRRL